MKQTETTKTKDLEWHAFDADNKVLGRMAQEIAVLLQGKHRVDYVPNVVLPVFVLVTNTDKVAVTGKKEQAKMYRHYSGHPGGLKERTLAEQRRRDSRVIVEHAVYGMLPKNNLRDERMKHLKLFKDEEHPHEAQINTKEK
jgi:large subunit ribosomal protein L13